LSAPALKEAEGRKRTPVAVAVYRPRGGGERRGGGVLLSQCSGDSAVAISAHDRNTLRELAEEWARIAAHPANEERRREWVRLNDLRRAKPMVCIYEIPWDEIHDEELTAKCHHPVARAIEEAMRRTIYQWRHVPGDIVVRPVIYSPLVVRDTDVLTVEMECVGLAKQFRPQITDERDLDKLADPVVVYDEDETQQYHELYKDLFGDIVAVDRGRHPPSPSYSQAESEGERFVRAVQEPLDMFALGTYWFVPWDQLVMWTGMQEALRDLIKRPGFLHDIMGRLTEAWLTRLCQYEALGLIGSDNNDYGRTGQGGLGYTEDLPVRSRAGQEEVSPTSSLWATAFSQPLGVASPAMHEEFALQYESKWLRRFGLTYYGCCEPLHHKIGILQKHIPNLRKISCSPWADVTSFAEQCSDRYVISLKMSPAVFAADEFDLDAARDELHTKLMETRGCNVEIVMKDISTIREDPERLHRWAEMAKEVSEEFA